MPWTCEYCGGWKNMDQGNHANDEPCSCLTFAEAMALDPSKVEYRSPLDAQWRLVASELGTMTNLATLRATLFRRARPKRSRVQFACADCAQLSAALRKCMEAMVMQENRENESFHIAQPADRAIWDEAKAAATKAFADTDK